MMHVPTQEQVERARTVAAQVAQWKQSNVRRKLECRRSSEGVTREMCAAIQKGLVFQKDGRPWSPEIMRVKLSLCYGCIHHVPPFEELKHG